VCDWIVCKKTGRDGECNRLPPSDEGEQGRASDRQIDRTGSDQPIWPEDVEQSGKLDGADQSQVKIWMTAYDVPRRIEINRDGKQSAGSPGVHAQTSLLLKSKQTRHVSPHVEELFNLLLFLIYMKPPGGSGPVQ
jgi:hypothetical protein